MTLRELVDFLSLPRRCDLNIILGHYRKVGSEAGKWVDVSVLGGGNSRQRPWAPELGAVVPLHGGELRGSLGFGGNFFRRR
jgi:hypothetical protein